MTGRRIAVVLYKYPLGVSTMLINMIAMLRERGAEVVVFADDDQRADLPCDEWLQDLLRTVRIVPLSLFRRARIKCQTAAEDFVDRLLCTLGGSTVAQTYYSKDYRLRDFAESLQDELISGGFDTVLAVESLSLIAAERASRSLRKVVLWFADMELLDWGEDNPLYYEKRALKHGQVRALRRVSRVFITSWERKKMFVTMNAYPEDRVWVLPVVPRRREILSTSYFRERFSIPREACVVVYSGNFMPWAECVEIIESMRTWPSDAVLVMHTWNKNVLSSDYFAKMQDAAKGKAVFFSSDYLAYDDLAGALSSADIGLLYYAPIDGNFTEIAFSSNKFGEYMAAGLPVISSPYPSLKTLVEGEGIGLAVGHADIGAAIRTIIASQERYRTNVKSCREKMFVFERYFDEAFSSEADENPSC